MENRGYGIPIGFFTFNRLDTTKQVFEQIREIKPEKLYLISDGARENRAGEAEKVQSVRQYLESHIDWPCEVHKNYAQSNMGCKKRMASGITWLLENEEMAIILEDDVKPTKGFFLFMEEMLNKYRYDEKIMLVSGFKYLNKYPVEDSYTFSNHSMIWGWGTWRRAWKYYDIDIKNWEKRKKDGSLKQYFNFWGYKVMARHFDSVYNHVRDTWDYQWSFTVYDRAGLSIVPKVNMIENLGFGRDDAAHTTGESNYDFSVGSVDFPLKHPKEIKPNKAYDAEYVRSEWGTRMMMRKVVKKLLHK